MAGKKRIDQIEGKIAQLESARQGDAAAQRLATLSDAQLAELRRRLEAGEDPLTVVKEMGI
jgi:ABC-type hemin transport system substrate-binding protein